MDYQGAGIILYNKGSVLIIKDICTGKWSFPKGAREDIDGIDPIVTAARECYEEVGLLIDRDYMLIETPPIVVYDRIYFSGVMKPFAERSIVIQESEVLDYCWLDPTGSCSYWADLNTAVRHYVKSIQKKMKEFEPLRLCRRIDCQSLGVY